MKVVAVLPEQNADLDFAKQFSRWQYFQSSAYICENAETQKSGKIKNMKGVSWRLNLYQIWILQNNFQGERRHRQKRAAKLRKWT